MVTSETGRMLATKPDARNEAARRGAASPTKAVDLRAGIREVTDVAQTTAERTDVLTHGPHLPLGDSETG